jgi:DNA-binding NtrC family response regulator
MSDQGRVLVIDRHSQWLDFAVATLIEAGYEVLSASDFEMASKRWRDASFDLILVGLDQAESHLSTMSDLAKDRVHPKRIVVMFPIRQTYDRMRIVFKAGAYDIVDKPYEAAALQSMVAKQISEARQKNRSSTRLS